MGWLWATPPAASSSIPTASAMNQSSSAQAVKESSFPVAQKQPRSVSHDGADQEVQSFLSELVSASTQKPDSPKIYTRSSPSSLSSRSQSFASTPDQLDSSLPIAEHILPTTMSCRQLFDQAFYCNSVGGRWNDVYRYGTVRSCSEDWNDFWFCMKTRGFGDGQSKSIRNYYRDKERRKYSKELGKESSENVWKSRDNFVEQGEAMRGSIPEFGESVVVKGEDGLWAPKE